MRPQPFSPLSLATVLDLGPTRNVYAKRRAAPSLSSPQPKQATSQPSPQPKRATSLREIYAARRMANG